MKKRSELLSKTFELSTAWSTKTEDGYVHLFETVVVGMKASDGSRKTWLISRARDISTRHSHVIICYTKTKYDIDYGFDGRQYGKCYKDDASFEKAIRRIEKKYCPI